MTLERAGVPYAVVGGHAVAAWVASKDLGGVRQTLDVDILIRRADFDATKAALIAAGFEYRHAKGLDMFLDPGTRAHDGVHLLFANELVREDSIEPNPDVTNSTTFGAYRVIELEALVRLKLTAFRDKDRTHLRDMIGVGLIDQSWTARLPAPLAARLQELLDTPDG